MLNQKGDTAVYLLYSYIRICSILRNCGISEEEIRKADFEFTDDYEKVLASHLVKFSEMIDYVSSPKLSLNFICSYMFVLSQKVSSGYKRYRINGCEETAKRVKLMWAVKEVMKKCFYLLGIKTIDRI